MTHVPINELTFGIELEVIMPAASNGEAGRSALARGLTDEGLVCEHEAYNHRTRPYWKIVTDGSIGHTNAELVSPVLRGEDGFEQVRKACRALDAHGCRVNRMCGMHVHVGVRDRFAEQIGFFKELVATYAKYEPIIDGLVSRSRRARNSQWCQPVVFNESVERATTIDRVMSAANPGGRYSKLNLTAFNVHGTVEFRQHQGTTNAQKIESWVKLCLRMVAHAARNTEWVGVSGEFVPPPAPLLPPAPRFLTVGAVDLERVTGDDIPRFTRENHYRLSDLVITYVIDRTPRRHGTAGRVNHDNHNVAAFMAIGRGTPMSLWDYHRHGGLRTHLAWDVDHGYVRVIRRSTAPAIDLPAEERARREALIAEHRAAVERLQREHAETVVMARAAWVAARGETAPVARPPTAEAPTTLDGLMELISAPETERAYFTERQMELS